MRVIPSRVPTVDELQLPPVLKSIADEERGLILVTGTTGSGKSTTLAAMLNHINNARADAHHDGRGPDRVPPPRQQVDHQPARNPDRHRRRSRMALRSALRQDPDVILVGEMRDLETVETALLAAETGHLVFSTLHTLDAPESINRIVAVFPPHQQRQVRLQLASILKAVVSQRLMPRSNGQGRIAAVEVMIATPFIRDCILDKDKTHSILGAIAAGTSQYGMQTFDQSIFGHYKKGVITLRRRAALRDQPGRVQAQGPGHRDDVGDGARGDAPGVAPGRRDLALRRIAGPHAHPASFGPARRRAVFACTRVVHYGAWMPTSSPSGGSPGVS